MLTGCVTTTGTGWINPVAASALELLWDGDTALAGYQYSYLPSWLSFLVDAGRAREAGAELFNAVHERWSELPEDDRPLLLVFGESLGADGAEAAFSGIADVRNRADGMLLVGPPNSSELWRTFTERRDPGALEHLPIYDGGATVRFASDPVHLTVPEAPWYHPRVVYLQHASDPIVWWSPGLTLREPDGDRSRPWRMIPAAMMIAFGALIVLSSLAALLLLLVLETSTISLESFLGVLLLGLSGGLWVTSGILVWKRRWWLMVLALGLGYAAGVVGSSLLYPLR
jgi:hypothetical protein